MSLDIFIGKKILFIGLGFYAYDKAISNAIEHAGASVSYFNMTITDFNFRLLNRVSKHAKSQYVKSYQSKLLLLDNDFDYVFCIKGEVLDIGVLNEVKSSQPKATFILYLWDAMHKTPRVVDRLPFFDKVFSFEKIDCIKFGFSFLPLFFCDRFTTEGNTPVNRQLYFYGSYHSDRYLLMRAFKDQCINNGIQLISDLYIKFIDRIRIRNLDPTLYIKKKISFNEIAEKSRNSNAIIDIHEEFQHGLSMRVIECLGMKKKIVTTNSDIVNYDFFNESNTLVLDRDKVDSCQLIDFIDKPYNVDESVRSKYTLENWLKVIFS